MFSVIVTGRDARNTGKQRAKKIAAQLIEKSIKYECIPLPNDEWEFGVRQDVCHILDSIIDKVINQ